ncbi:hypothetical protein EZS27_029937 [termite gut metagenome]|uniref:Acyltransferase 3 domain-containing protein n=1 Tax=termite gut metagenome TaxID=433724 RepID=A0A5J4QH72_9ZZZZ
MLKEKLQSKTIDFLRFPLIAIVVLIHSNLAGGVYIDGGINLVSNIPLPVYGFINNFVTQALSGLAVPHFYFFAGFLFFYKMDFSFSNYLKKMKNRVNTLLIPYLFWNFVVIIFFFLAQTLMPGMMSGVNKLIAEFSIIDWIAAFWNHHEGHPICSQFWFIRDLMIVVLCTPLIFGIAKYLRLYGIIVLGILWYFGIWFSIPGFSITAFFFFSLGAWFSINKYSFVQDSNNRYYYLFILLYPVLVLANLLTKGFEWNIYIHYARTLASIIFSISLIAYLLNTDYLHTNKFLPRASFFVFAFHGMPLRFIIKFGFKLFQPQSDISVLLLYLLCPVVTIAIGLLLYFSLMKYLPRFTDVITGRKVVRNI